MASIVLAPLRIIRTKFSIRRLVGLVIVAIVISMCICAPLLAPYPPEQSTINTLAEPSNTHLLGTNDLGQDILSQLFYGGRISLVIGLGAAVLAALLGIPAGLVAGYFGGWVDASISYVTNMFIAMPSLVLAVIITAVIGASLPNLILILGVVGWPAMARLMRGQTLAIRERTFVEAAHVAGAGAIWILWYHVRPNISRLAWSQLSLTIAQAIFTSSSLSFLGLGVPPPLVDWGGMVHVGGYYLAINPPIVIAPSAAVGITILGFYLAGTGR